MRSDCLKQDGDGPLQNRRDLVWVLITFGLPTPCPTGILPVWASGSSQTPRARRGSAGHACAHEHASASLCPASPPLSSAGWSGREGGRYEPSVGQIPPSGCEGLGGLRGEGSGFISSAGCYKYVSIGANWRAAGNLGCAETVI